jgi:hypothetical protein
VSDSASRQVHTSSREGDVHQTGMGRFMSPDRLSYEDVKRIAAEAKCLKYGTDGVARDAATQKAMDAR